MASILIFSNFWSILGAAVIKPAAGAASPEGLASREAEVWEPFKCIHRFGHPGAKCVFLNLEFGGPLQDGKGWADLPSETPNTFCRN